MFYGHVRITPSSSCQQATSFPVDPDAQINNLGETLHSYFSFAVKLYKFYLLKYILRTPFHHSTALLCLTHLSFPIHLASTMTYVFLPQSYPLKSVLQRDLSKIYLATFLLISLVAHLFPEIQTLAGHRELLMIWVLTFCPIIPTHTSHLQLFTIPGIHHAILPLCLLYAH